MNVSLQFPFDLHWTSDDLADAVPLRLSELPDYDAHREGHGIDSANAALLGPRRWTPISRPRPDPLLFRIC